MSHLPTRPVRPSLCSYPSWCRDAYPRRSLSTRPPSSRSLSYDRRGKRKQKLECIVSHFPFSNLIFYPVYVANADANSNRYQCTASTTAHVGITRPMHMYCQLKSSDVVRCRHQYSNVIGVRDWKKRARRKSGQRIEGITSVRSFFILCFGFFLRVCGFPESRGLGSVIRLGNTGSLRITRSLG